MGKPPAVIIVVRHGARLDAADPQWHLTSPTPYDPPLTYGGWSQSKFLGARIANILRSRETEEEVLTTTVAESLTGKDRGKKRHKIVIHTSPFLRCVQTSIAISAGLAQNSGQSPVSKHNATSPGAKPMHSSPRIRPLVSGSPALLPIYEPTIPWGKDKSPERRQTIQRAVLRVDSFLGEWLSPDYFDLITPPPSSIIMLAGAKADLLRREDYSNLVHTKDNKASQPFPGGWGCPSVPAKGDDEKKAESGPLSELSSLAAALPKRERTFSLSSSGSHGNRHRGTASHVQPPGSQGAHGGYQSPVPSYAVSSSDSIPPGYVSHARDACVEVDYQWDSMREPHNLGNGGEYGEEWSSMHKRFRTGLHNLVEWYQRSDESSKLLTRNRSNSLRTFSPEEEAAGKDLDLVVILVTHGAGCNALIGALTNQPVLLDVGMASLTMAIRKPTQSLNSIISGSEISTSHYRKDPSKTSISDQYDVKLIASNEHLRSSATSTPSSSRAPSVTGFSSIRDRLTNSGSNDLINLNRSRSQNSSLGSIRRTASVTGNHVARSYVPPRLNSVGLWTAPRHREEAESEEDDMILNFGNDETSTKHKPGAEKETSGSITRTPELEINEIHGSNDTSLELWGSSPAPCVSDKTEKSHETTQKRRWTIHDRESMVGLGRTTA